MIWQFHFPDLAQFFAMMTSDLLLALVLFAFVSSITPGPNNLMLLASGANFGFRRTLPHMFGISIGHMIMVALMGAGLAQVFALYPPVRTGLKLAAILYMAWLAWKIANAVAPEPGRAGGRPLSFLQAAGFQWVNPKAWMMAITAIAAYAPDQAPLTVATVCLVFAAINMPSVGCWTVLGQQMALLLTSRARLVWFNRSMAALLLISLYPVLAL
jgi:threonine/homoserine/homoserine lactone efflux protein